MKLTAEQKQARKDERAKAKAEAKELARIHEEQSQPFVKELTISIEWKKSRTWGGNPHASVEVKYFEPHAGEWKTGYFKDSGFTASGCGYDKESTVIAQIFNKYLKYKLWQLTDDQIKGGNGSLDEGRAPYGIHQYTPNRRHFGDGIGTSCYYNICKYIGGKFEHVASGKTFDVYKYTDNEA